MASDGVGGCLRLGRFLPKISALCPFNSRSRVFSNFAPLLAPCLAPALLATSRLEPAFAMDLFKDYGSFKDHGSFKDLPQRYSTIPHEVTNLTTFPPATWRMVMGEGAVGEAGGAEARGVRLQLFNTGLLARRPNFLTVLILEMKGAIFILESIRTTAVLHTRVITRYALAPFNRRRLPSS